MSEKMNVKFIFIFKSDERSSVINVSNVDCLDAVREETDLIFGKSNFDYWFNDNGQLRQLKSSQEMFDAIKSTDPSDSVRQIKLELRDPIASQPESFMAGSFQSSSHLSDKTKTELEKLRQEIFEKTRREMNELIQNAKNDFRESIKQDAAIHFGQNRDAS